MLELKKSHNFSFHLERQPRHLVESRNRSIGKNAMRVLEPTSPIEIQNESSLEDDDHWVLKATIDPVELENYLENMMSEMTDQDKEIISGAN